MNFVCQNFLLRSKFKNKVKMVKLFKIIDKIWMMC